MEPSNYTVNYICDSKINAKHHDNYTDDVLRDFTSDKTDCGNCIFAGTNKEITSRLLCGKHLREVAEVRSFATCDKGRSALKWYNRINPINKYVLESSGFVFKNR